MHLAVADKFPSCIFGREEGERTRDVVKILPEHGDVVAGPKVVCTLRIVATLCMLPPCPWRVESESLRVFRARRALALLILHGV